HTTAPGRLNCSPAPSLRSLPGLFTRWRRKARHHHPCLPHRRPRLHLPFHSGGQRPTIGGQAGTSSDRRGPMSGRRGSRSMATGIDLIVLDSSISTSGAAASATTRCIGCSWTSAASTTSTPVIHPGSELLLQIDPRASSIDPQRRHRAGGLRREVPGWLRDQQVAASKERGEVLRSCKSEILLDANKSLF
ncbi:unnamed protein product, partial [Urochloa humidicola]